MRRVLMLVTPLAVMAAGCGQNPEVVVEAAPPEVVVQAAQPEFVVEVPSTTAGVTSGIVVTGEGRSSGTPDVLTVDLGVDVFRSSVSDSMAEAARLGDAILAVLQDHGVEEPEIQTRDFSVFPEFDFRQGRERVVGYRVSHVLSVDVRDIASAGEILDASARAAGDDFRVRNVRLSIDDNASLLDQARDAAWDDAFHRATQLAALSGVELGPPVAINESPTPIVPSLRTGGFYASDLARSTVAEIEPGEASVSVAVEVLFPILGSDA